MLEIYFLTWTIGKNHLIYTPHNHLKAGDLILTEKDKKECNLLIIQIQKRTNSVKHYVDKHCFKFYLYLNGYSSNTF